MWGFAERHLPWAASAIRDTGWRVAPSHGPLCLVVGDTNFAHYAWNQLSALDDLPLAEIHHDVRVVATQQPLGPMHEILPALPPWEVEVLPDTSLQALNRPGLVFTPVGAHLITAAPVRQDKYLRRAADDRPHADGLGAAARSLRAGAVAQRAHSVTVRR